jgi:hypothetical protein
MSAWRRQLFRHAAINRRQYFARSDMRHLHHHHPVEGVRFKMCFVERSRLFL